jgi:hypothetical protein
LRKARRVLGMRAKPRFKFLDPSVSEIGQVREILADHVMSGLDKAQWKLVLGVMRKRSRRG